MIDFSEVPADVLSLIETVQKQAGRAWRIVCEGIDKYQIGSASFHSLAPVLNLLTQFKTLLEVNAVHLFGRHQAWQQVPSVLIPLVPPTDLRDLLTKRLGLYEAARRSVLPSVVAFAGGNPRQALRLLAAFDYERGSRQRSVEEALTNACNRVRVDYLYLAFESTPADVLVAVDRDGFVRAGVVEGVGIMTPAAQAIYRNWIVIRSEPETGDRWQAQLNPLLQPAQLVADTLPPGPEANALRKWAETHGVNPYGLDFDTACTSSAEVMGEVASTVASTRALSIVDLLDTLAVSLFSVERQDRTLIAYRDANVMTAARDYLMGKASEMGFFPTKLIDLESVNFLLAQLIDARLIYNVVLPRRPDKVLLSDLDRRRDCFVSFEVLWWVHIDDLPLCLQSWPQLRQLMSVYRLEDGLLAGLEADEVQADLEYLGLLSKDDSVDEASDRLKHVLEVLRDHHRR